MSKIYSTDEDEGNTDEYKIAIIKKAPGVPGNDKNAGGDDNAKYLSQAMEKQVIIQTS
jgi:hypothetical protein